MGQRFLPHMVRGVSTPGKLRSGTFYEFYCWVFFNYFPVPSRSHCKPIGSPIHSGHLPRPFYPLHLASWYSFCPRGFRSAILLLHCFFSKFAIVAELNNWQIKTQKSSLQTTYCCDTGYPALQNLFPGCLIYKRCCITGLLCY